MFDHLLALRGQTCDNVPNLCDGNEEENEVNDRCLIFCELVLRDNEPEPSNEYDYNDIL